MLSLPPMNPAHECEGGHAIITKHQQHACQPSLKRGQLGVCLCALVLRLSNNNYLVQVRVPVFLFLGGGGVHRALCAW